MLFVRSVSNIGKEVPFFLYANCNTSQNCIFQPSGNPNVETFPQGTTNVRPHLLDTGYERIPITLVVINKHACMKPLYVLHVAHGKLKKTFE